MYVVCGPDYERRSVPEQGGFEDGLSPAMGHMRGHYMKRFLLSVTRDAEYGYEDVVRNTVNWRPFILGTCSECPEGAELCVDDGKLGEEGGASGLERGQIKGGGHVGC